jgi:hypothetical protein
LIGVLWDIPCSSGAGLPATAALVVVASCGVLLQPADCGLGQFSVGVPCLDPIGGIFGLVHRGSGFLAPDLAIEPSAPFTIISNWG